MKAREGYFRAYDNQMVMEMYAVRAKEAAKMKDQWDIYDAARHRARPERGPGSHRAAEGRRVQDRRDASITAARSLPLAGRWERASDARIEPSPRPASPAELPQACRIVQLIFILEQVLNGLLVGVYYLLIALGLSLIFSLGGIVNLAHGAFYAIGAYLAVMLRRPHRLCRRFVAAPVLVGLLGIAIERLLFRRFYRSDPILSLLLTFGLAMVAEQGLRMIFGASPLPLLDARQSCAGSSSSATSSIRTTA